MKRRNMRWCLYKVALSIVLVHSAAGCSSSNLRIETVEKIFFVSIGNQPFKDEVYTIDTNGKNVRLFLSPVHRRSYMHISGNSLNGPFIVLVHEETALDKTKTTNALYKWIPSNGAWKRLLSGNNTLEEGEGRISPNNSFVAFARVTLERPSQYELWLANCNTGENKKLYSEEGSWVRSLSWSRDSKELAFIKFRYYAHGLVSTLMSISIDGTNPTTLLEQEEGVVGACYSPLSDQLAIWSKRGLEIMDVSDKKRVTILPWKNSKPIYLYRESGIDWSRRQSIITLALFNSDTQQDEIWTVSTDGSDSKAIYNHNNGKIKSVSFIE
jgi:hypothetical protein